MVTADNWKTPGIKVREEVWILKLSGTIFSH
jgi:hypothetical protein